jgi:acyl carrier protein
MATQSIDELILDIKKELISRLNLEDMKPEDLDETMPLFGEGLGLDSIDALEIIVMLEKNYKIKITDPKQGKDIFQNVRTIAEYVSVHRDKAPAA